MDRIARFFGRCFEPNGYRSTLMPFRAQAVQRLGVPLVAGLILIVPILSSQNADAVIDPAHACRQNKVDGRWADLRTQFCIDLSSSIFRILPPLIVLGNPDPGEPPLVSAPPLFPVPTFDPMWDDIGRDNPADSHGQFSCGNPIDLATGNKYQREVDFVGVGELPLAIVRHYNSSQIAGFGNIKFGKQWTLDTFDRLLVPRHSAPTSMTVDRVQIARGSGQTIELYREDGHPWRRTNGTKELFARSSDNANWLHSEGDVLSIFASGGQILSKHHVNGESLHYVYGTANRLTRIEHNSGRFLAFTYDSAFRVQTITDAAGNVYQYGYDSQDNLTSVTYPTNGSSAPVRTYHYTAAGLPHHLTKITDERGFAFAEWTYDAVGRGTSSKHANNSETMNVAYLSGGVTRTTNALGKVTDYGSSEHGGKMRAQTVNGFQNGTCLAANQQYTYDTRGYYDKVTDWSGNVTDYDYNDKGQVLSVTRGFGTPEVHQTAYEWNLDYLDKPTKITTPTLETVIEYMGGGLVDKITQTNLGPFGAVGEQRVTTITYQFNAVGIMTQRVIDGPRSGVSDVTTYNYDAEGKLANITNALGHVTTYSNYDALGRVGRITFPSGLIRDFEYHPRGWITATTDIVNGVSRRTEMQHDRVGLLTKITYPDASWITFGYNPQRYLVTMRSSGLSSLLLDNLRKFEYDVAGNVVREAIEKRTFSFFPPFPPPPPGEPPEGNVTITTTVLQESTYQYDALSRLMERIGGEGQTDRYSYDLSNRVTDSYDPLNRRTQMQYDALDRLTRVTDPANAFARYEYDTDNRMDLVDDKKGNDTVYETNGFGDVTRRISPDTGTTTYTYDAAGNLKTMLDARGKLTTYTYDALNRHVRTDFADTTSYVYTYDTERKGYLYRVTDSSGTTTFNRNTAGEVLTKTAVVAGTTMTTTTTRDVLGRVATIGYPGGTTVYYTYDSVGNVSRVEASHPSFTRRNIASSIQYQPYGPMKSLTYGNGESLSRSYDLDYRLTGLTSGTVVNRGYGYNATDTISSIYDSATAQNRTYNYDVLDRLSSYTGPGGSHSYLYDTNGNRTRETVSGAITYFNNASTSNKLTSLSGAQAHSRSYDNNGNTLTIGAQVFTYSDANRLATYRPTSGGTLTSYSYNSLGERVYKTRSGFTQRFVYGGGARVWHERGTQGTRDYIYLNGELIAFVHNGGLYYVHNDHLATPQVVTTNAGNVKWRANPKPFGEMSPTVNLVTLNVRFPGQYLDSESGLHYNYYRYYDADSGRYITSDPIGLAGGLNSYVYAGGSPVHYVDPLGLTEQDVNELIDLIEEETGDIKFGEWKFEQMEPGVEARTSVWGGVVQVPEEYGGCLSKNDFFELAKDLLHEGMHATDPMRKRLWDRVRGNENLSANHERIYNRERWEMGEPALEPVLEPGETLDDYLGRRKDLPFAGELWGLGTVRQRGSSQKSDSLVPKIEALYDDLYSGEEQ